MRFPVLALCLLLPVPAFAHAILIRSDPADRGQIAAGPHALQFRFNSRIDQSRSRLTLTGTNAQIVLPLEQAAAPDLLQAQAELTPGSYTIRWQVLAVDGHMTRGDVRFTVTPTAAAAPSQGQ